MGKGQVGVGAAAAAYFRNASSALHASFKELFAKDQTNTAADSLEQDAPGVPAAQTGVSGVSATAVTSGEPLREPGVGSAATGVTGGAPGEIEKPGKSSAATGVTSGGPVRKPGEESAATGVTSGEPMHMPVEDSGAA